MDREGKGEEKGEEKDSEKIKGELLKEFIWRSQHAIRKKRKEEQKEE